MSRTVSHLMGTDVLVEGRYLRQRCSWCGLAVIDEDLELVMVPEGQGPGVPRWAPGTWVRIDDGCPTVYTLADADEGKLPPDACTQDVLPNVRLVGG